MSESYSQIFDSLYAPDSQRTIAGLDPLDQKAWTVLRTFLSRKGFDWWWKGVAENDQDEIFDKIRKAIQGSARGEFESALRRCGAITCRSTPERRWIEIDFRELEDAQALHSLLITKKSQAQAGD